MPKTEKVAVAPKNTEKVVDKTTEKTTDETVTPQEPVTKAPNTDVRTLVEESLVEDNLTGTTEEDGDTSEPLTDPSTEETTEDETSETTEPLDEDDSSDEDSEEAETDGTELDEFLKEPPLEETPDVEKKSGEQKRIDKLTASNYEKDAEIARLKALPTKADDTKVDVKPKYTNAQLAEALEKAREKGDTSLEVEIMQHISDAKADSVKAEFKAKEEAVLAAQKKSQTDWVNITEMFHYDEVEMYPGSQTDLNIKDASSLVYRLASELYNNHGFKDKENGMALSVSKALRLILDKKKKSAKPQKSSKEKQLETKVKKLKRKTSSPSGSKTVKPDPVKKESRPKSDSDKVNDAISERKELNTWKHI